MSESIVHVVALVGSLRKDSINRRLALAAVDNAPEGVSVTLVDGLERLPFYNEDLDSATGSEADDIDPAVARLRAQVGAADAVLLATPEYNGSTPAVLKNAIDWLSRPYGNGALKDKPVGVIGAALGRYAGTWSRADTRKSVGIAGGRVVEEVDFGIQASGLDDGALHADVVDGVGAAVRALADQVPSRL
ncbi:NAD(P)H-dependent oxidoreductase [Gordonia oryzae]|uniref:NAD(P)H-dependent oxidoreductase n=1 Tax=Gordonia oryzae TaxID=2487349 RepID=A0A3N4GHG2_9ACTN|nr:NAD(P)H-dependent oxidoreductase [Gordonia oryzae]RPA62293.1 NAD(P)H-dependent oxidoreductase [Gordonia oryzae]